MGFKTSFKSALKDDWNQTAKLVGLGLKRNSMWDLKGGLNQTETFSGFKGGRGLKPKPTPFWVLERV